ncbi:MAG: hypothetical protein GTO16_03715 [Candidatus Aminicenantes bacterium]|nr:hypothetical protein [Candidatus Aminicenantes bacterium]
MKKALSFILGIILLFCGTTLAQNVIDFEDMLTDVLADDVYQSNTPFFSGVLIQTINNVTGNITGWPVVVRAHDNPIVPGDCGVVIPDYVGTVPAFSSNQCTGNSMNNYPVGSGFNSLSDTSEGIPPNPVGPRKQDGFLINFGYPVMDFSLIIVDWGDWLPGGSGENTWPSYVELIANDNDGVIVGSDKTPDLISQTVSRDAARANGIISLEIEGGGIREVEVRFRGFIDPGVTIDDIIFTSLNIDIKPGSDANRINSNGHGVIPVAILGSADFDVTTLDPSTVMMDGQGVRMKGKSGRAGSYEDVNDDGFIDLVVHIEDGDVYTTGDTVGTVTAETCEGELIGGQDSISII